MSETDAFGNGLSRAWTLADARAALARRARVLLIAFAALSAGAVAAVLMAPPIHEGGFKLLVKRDRADAVISGVAGADAGRPDLLSEQELLSQVELLKTQDLRDKVATEAGLTARLLATGEAATDEEALARAVKALDRNLVVTPIKKTWLISVTYRDKDPQVARNVLDSMVRSYFEKHLTLHRPSGTFEFFSEQVEGARREVASAQAALVQYTQTAGVVSADAEQQSALQKLTEFDALRAQAQAALAEATDRQSAASAELSRVPAQRTSQTRVMQNPVTVQDSQSRVLALETRRTELLQRFTPEYRGVVETEQQLGDARAALTRALDTRIHEETVADNPTHQWLDTEAARARTDHAALKARVASLSSAVARYRAQAQGLELRSAEQRELALRLAAAEDRYRLYLAKQEEARISDELDKTRIANVAIAQAPSLTHEPVRRPSLAMLPLLIVIALMLSGALALAVDVLAAVPVYAYAAPVPSTAAAQMVALTQRGRKHTARLSARLVELRNLTDSVAAQWSVGDEPARPARPDASGASDKKGWLPVPHADGLRQGA